MAKGKTLFVSDFDDTLAQTDAKVYVVKSNGKRIEMSPEKYAVYEPEDKDTFDFSEFNELKNPRPIVRFVKLLKKAIAHPAVDKVAVLTARGHTRPVAQFLRMHGIEHGVAIAALGDSNPQRKANYIDKHIKRDGYTRVAFLDDSPKNVAAVKQLQQKHPQIKLLVHKVEPPIHAPAVKSATQKTPHQQALDAGLEDYKFGRYGNEGTVTHVIDNGKLIKKP
jgi:hypothetical protein